MVQLFEYYGRFQGMRGRIGGLPGWARGLIFVAALPGAVLIGLSVLALLVSILALLLLTVPLYRVLQSLVGTTRPAAPQDQGAPPPGVFGFPGSGAGDLAGPGRKKVDVTIIE
jgi:hypothetical protein